VAPPRALTPLTSRPHTHTAPTIMSPTARAFAHRALAASFAALLLTPSPAAAQTASGVTNDLGPATASGEPRFQGGVSFSAGQPRGAFHRYVDDGYGLGAHGLFRVGREGALALRLDGGFLNYGRETLRLPLSTRPGGGRVQLDLTTTNNIFWLGVGPQLMAPRGVVRPYVNGTAGFSYFATTSSVRGRNNAESFAEDTNYDDAQFSWGGGAGVLVPVRRGARSLVFLDLGARYHDNGRNVRYLREGGVRDMPNGDVQLDVIRSRADLITWHVGVSIGGR
jgi:hypothetical protein